MTTSPRRPPQEEILRIFQNKFKAIYIYRLRHKRVLGYEAFQDTEQIGIEDGMLRLKGGNGVVQGFYEIFLRGLGGGRLHQLYCRSCFPIWKGSIRPPCHPFTILWQHPPAAKSLRVARGPSSYDNRGTCTHHCQQPSDLSKLCIPSEFQGRFCTPMTLIGVEALR